MTAPIFPIFTIKPSSAEGVKTQLVGRAYVYFDVSNGKTRNLIIRIFSVGESLPFGSTVRKSMTGPMGILNGRNIHS